MEIHTHILTRGMSGLFEAFVVCNVVQEGKKKLNRKISHCYPNEKIKDLPKTLIEFALPGSLRNKNKSQRYIYIYCSLYLIFIK